MVGYVKYRVKVRVIVILRFFLLVFCVNEDIEVIG